MYHDICKLLQIYEEKLEKNDIRQTSDPRFLCTVLPSLGRVKIALKVPFKLYALTAIPDGTLVTLTAFTDRCCSPTVLNNEAEMNWNVAEFPKLKFMNSSGRGKKFDLKIVIHTKPTTEIFIRDAIKITVDGARKPRRPRFKGECRPRGRPKRIPLREQIQTQNKKSLLAKNDVKEKCSNKMDVQHIGTVNRCSVIVLNNQNHKQYPRSSTQDTLDQNLSFFPSPEIGKNSVESFADHVPPISEICGATAPTIFPTTCINQFLPNHDAGRYKPFSFSDLNENMQKSYLKRTNDFLIISSHIASLNSEIFRLSNINKTLSIPFISSPYAIKVNE